MPEKAHRTRCHAAPARRFRVCFVLLLLFAFVTPPPVTLYASPPVPCRDADISVCAPRFPESAATYAAAGACCSRIVCESPADHHYFQSPGSLPVFGTCCFSFLTAMRDKTALSALICCVRCNKI